jgi:hypothetical protein
MDRPSEAADRIQQIEAQQDAILQQLEELERRTEQVLAEHAPPRAPQPAVDGTAPLAIEPTPASTPEVV